MKEAELNCEVERRAGPLHLEDGEFGGGEEEMEEKERSDH